MPSPSGPRWMSARVAVRSSSARIGFSRWAFTRPTIPHICPPRRPRLESKLGIERGGGKSGGVSRGRPTPYFASGGGGVRRGAGVLLIGDYPPPMGGIAVHVQQLHRGFRRNGLACRVLDIGKRGRPDSGVIDGRGYKNFARH